MNKIYAFIIILIIFVSYDKWRSGQSFEQGYNAHKAEIADSKDEAEAEDQENVKTVIKWRTKTKIEYRDRIKVINNAKDATGCLDTKLIDMGISLH